MSIEVHKEDLGVVGVASSGGASHYFLELSGCPFEHRSLVRRFQHLVVIVRCSSFQLHCESMPIFDLH